MLIEDGSILKPPHRPSAEVIFEEWYHEVTKKPLWCWFGAWTVVLYALFFYLWHAVAATNGYYVNPFPMWLMLLLVVGFIAIPAAGYLASQVCVHKFHAKRLWKSFAHYFEDDCKFMLERRLDSFPSFKR